MKKILVPTDFSDCANNASDLGIYLAKQSKAEIHFIHLLRTPVDWKSLKKEQEKNFPETIHEIGRVNAELAKLKIKSEKEGLNVQTSLVFANDSIADHIGQYNADLIVMGSHGVKGFKAIFGSNTQIVVRHSKKPVLVVKMNEVEPKIENIVFASTWEKDNYDQFNKVAEFANLFDSKIHLLFVNVPNEIRESSEIELKMNELMACFPELEYSVNIYDSINEEGGILQFTESKDADLIALITHGKSGFQQLISSSITESLVNHSSIPILSINSN